MKLDRYFHNHEAPRKCLKRNDDLFHVDNKYVRQNTSMTQDIHKNKININGGEPVPPN